MEINTKTVITLFAERGDFRQFFTDKTPVDLHRFRTERTKDRPVMEPELTGFQTKKGYRKPDITIFTGKDGTPWVEAGSGGVSLFDRPVDMGSTAEYYILPVGMDLPAGLVISKDSWNARFSAFHYTIHPVFDMPLRQFLGLLQHLELKLLATVRSK